MENGSQNGPGNSGWCLLLTTWNRYLFRRSIILWILITRWLPFGALLVLFGIPLAPFWHPLAPFWLPFAIDFCFDFWRHFWWKIIPKRLPFPGVGCYVFGTFFVICSKGRSVYAFQSPFCSLWAIFWLPSGSFSYPFGSLLVPSGSLLLTSGFYFLILGSLSVIFKFDYTSNANLTEVKEFCANCS